MTATLRSEANDTRSVLRAMRRAVTLRKAQHHQKLDQLAVDAVERRELEGRADELADLAQMIEDLDALIRVNATTEPHAAPDFITVQQLAQALGQSDGATRKLLDAGLIPGARRKTPGERNSPWLIPSDAPSAYLSAFNRNGS